MYGLITRMPLTKATIEPICRSEGDNLARISVRLDEMKQSLLLIRETLEKMPEGEISCTAVDIPPDIETLSAVESPRGEMVHYIVTGQGKQTTAMEGKDSDFFKLTGNSGHVEGYQHC